MDPFTAPGAAVGADELAGLEEIVQDELPAYLEDLSSLVNTDCGSYTKAGVDVAGRWTGRFLERLGAEVTYHLHPTLGDTVVGELAGTPGGPRVLLIGHLDTVFPEGTARERPFRVADGRAYGPGVTDMKSGLLTGLYGLLAVIALGEEADEALPFERLTFVANPDEEIGSPSSTEIIRELALDSDLCFVLECARANGDIVSSRKGTLDLRLTVRGRAAHAGVEPEKGRSAILEASRQVQALHALNGRWPGVTVNVGVIAGGTRPNVVPEQAALEVDLRATSRQALEAAEAAVRKIVATRAATAAAAGTSTTIEEMGRHWPMEKLDRSSRLVAHAQALANRLGFAIRDAATGGASDANTTAGVGVPTLDGLGPIGGNDHSPDEYLEIESIVPRTVLFAALLIAVARDPVIASWRPHRA
jgi:glutamate carboxypeptidase